MLPNIWFTSDTHFGHERILELAKRPFPSIEEHDRVIIANWNAAVQPSDMVYHLGDFGLAKRDYLIEVRKKLNGNISLILGNHDSESERAGLRELFAWQKDLYLFKQRIEGREQRLHIHLCHYPLVTWCNSNEGSWHLHGHCHGDLPINPYILRIDIGVDLHGFAPVRLETVIALMEDRIAHGAGPQARHYPEKTP